MVKKSKTKSALSNREECTFGKPVRRNNGLRNSDLGTLPGWATLAASVITILLNGLSRRAPPKNSGASKHAKSFRGCLLWGESSTHPFASVILVADYGNPIQTC